MILIIFQLLLCIKCPAQALTPLPNALQNHYTCLTSHHPFTPAAASHQHSPVSQHHPRPPSFSSSFSAAQPPVCAHSSPAPNGSRTSNTSHPAPARRKSTSKYYTRNPRPRSAGGRNTPRGNPRRRRLALARAGLGSGARWGLAGRRA